MKIKKINKMKKIQICVVITVTLFVVLNSNCLKINKNSVNLTSNMRLSNQLEKYIHYFFISSYIKI